MQQSNRSDSARARQSAHALSSFFLVASGGRPSSMRCELISWSMKALGDKERAELSALSKPEQPKDRQAIIEKYAAQRKAAHESYMRELQPSPAPAKK